MKSLRPSEEDREGSLRQEEVQMEDVYVTASTQRWREVSACRDLGSDSSFAEDP